jgi:hypothetical protein
MVSSLPSFNDSKLIIKDSLLHLLPIEEEDKTSGEILMVTQTINHNK